MRLGKHFVLQALAQGAFYCGNRRLQPDAPWGFWEEGVQVSISIDSRSIKSGDFFVALAGPSFDGHAFVAQALAKGACGALISKSVADCVSASDLKLLEDKFFIVVSDTLDAFITLAKAWRQQWTCPVVGITGSVGKTTTKEMVRSILHSAGIDAYVSFKNYNNLIGLCYNILQVPLCCKAVVLEVGINEKNEMAQLADILRPSIGLITCIGHAHLAGFDGSLDMLAQEKRKLFSSFMPQDIGIVFGDQPLLGNICYSHPVARFGFKARSHVHGRRIVVAMQEDGTLKTQFSLKWYGKQALVLLKTNHAGFVHNALAAAAVAYFLHVPFEHVVKGLEAYEGMESRFEMKKLKNGNGVLFDDCYNANPESMKAALKAFSQLPYSGKKIAVLGDMLELGGKEAYWHRHIGRFISKSIEIDHVILVGKLAHVMTRTLPDDLVVEMANDWQEAEQKLNAMLDGQNAVILVKASHGMRLDNLVKSLAH